MGSLSFLTPAAALVALAGLLPAAVHLHRERRARAVRQALSLAEPAPGSRRLLLTALLAVPALAGLAAAQPVLDRTKEQRERVDAEVFVVLDTSRSMVAAAGPEQPTRLDRARAAALELRGRLPEVPAGVASLTDRTLPHLFPTVDVRSFAATLTRSVGIERPPPATFATVATDLSALAAVARQRFFSPDAKRRVLVVLTDGEAPEPGAALARALRGGRVETVFVHVRRPGESIYVTSAPDPAYRSDPASGTRLAQLAVAVGGASYAEDDLAGAAADVRARLGEGETQPRPRRDLLALMPYTMLAAALPLAFLIRRRNL